MREYRTDERRNITLLGAAGAGKTTLAEAIRSAAGGAGAIGPATGEEGRGQSIDPTVLGFQCGGVRVNLLDAPGGADFQGAALSSLMAADVAVIVLPRTGEIRAAARRMFEAAGACGLARLIVVNQCDLPGPPVAERLAGIRSAFGDSCTPVTRLLLADGCLAEVRDLLAEGDAESGERLALLERVVETDDCLLSAYLGGQAPSAAAIRQALRAAMASGRLIPVAFASAQTAVGVLGLIDLLVHCCPPPSAAGGPLAARVFGIVPGRPRGRLAYLRVVRGVWEPTRRVLINGRRCGRRAVRLFSAAGSELTPIPRAVAGELVVADGLAHAKVGDVVHVGEPPAFASPPYPEPMHAVAVEPARRADERRLSEGLAELAAADPCFRVAKSAETGERVIRCLGRTHLDAKLARLHERRGVQVVTRPPQIAYRETVCAVGEAWYKHKKQRGGPGQFAVVQLRVEPLPRGGEPPLEFVNEVFGGAIPATFIPAIEQGVREAMAGGCLAGFAVQDVKVTVLDGEHHRTDSKEVAFRIAGRECFRKAFGAARPVLLEPVEHLEVAAPTSCTGELTADVIARRGRVLGVETLADGRCRILAGAPAAELLEYTDHLRGMTAGEGSFIRRPDGYGPVPLTVQQRLIAAFAAR